MAMSSPLSGGLITASLENRGVTGCICLVLEGEDFLLSLHSVIPGMCTIFQYKETCFLSLLSLWRGFLGWEILLLIFSLTPNNTNGTIQKDRD